MARPVTMAAADTAASMRRSVSCSLRAFLTCFATPRAPNAVPAMDRYVPDLDFLKPLALDIALLTATEPPQATGAPTFPRRRPPRRLRPCTDGRPSEPGR